jgi:hypothetical protein
MFDRLRNAWNAFVKVGETDWSDAYPSVSYGSAPPQRTPLHVYSERSIVSSIYTRIAIDVAQCYLKHVRLDDKGRYQEDMETALNTCLTFEANLDQGPRQLRQDVIMTLFDHGVAAIVPVDTSRNPETNDIFDIYSLRVGEVKDWRPRHVKLSVYNELKGIREEIILEKRLCAIVENPLYSVMNEPNSTLQRLIRKLSLLDSVDEQISSGKLDIIIQLPYVVKSEQRKQQAEQRRDDLEFQLRGSKYGIAYTDGTEKITQLNRPAENTLLSQVEYLTKLLYVQLGLTPEVMDGTADEAAMRNYRVRTVEPIMDSITEAMQRAFLGLRGAQRNERIQYFSDPFKLVPVSEIAEIADKMVRNQVMAPNEIRQAIGMAPSDDPNADKLSNPNMPQSEQVGAGATTITEGEGNGQNGS